VAGISRCEHRVDLQPCEDDRVQVKGHGEEINESQGQSGSREATGQCGPIFSRKVKGSAIFASVRCAFQIWLKGGEAPAVMMIERHHVPELFEHDGALRSIMVLGIDDLAGEAFLDVLRSGRFGSAVYSEVGADAERIAISTFPRSFRELRERVSELHPSVELDLDGLRIWSNLLTCESWLELDFDPQQMTDRRLAALIDFITTVGRALGRDCIVAQESAADHQILAYRVETDRVVPVTHRHRRQ